MAPNGSIIDDDPHRIAYENAMSWQKLESSEQAAARSKMKTIVLRIVATFIYSAMSIVGGASVLGGIPVWKAAVLAGIAAASQVLERLARAYADDGKISRSEVDEAFGTGE